MMMLSIRLNKDLEQQLNAIARRRSTTLSSVIRDALHAYVEDNMSTATPYDIGKEFFGRHGNGQKNLSVTFKSRIKDKLQEKNGK